MYDPISKRSQVLVVTNSSATQTFINFDMIQPGEVCDLILRGLGRSFPKFHGRIWQAGDT